MNAPLTRADCLRKAEEMACMAAHYLVRDASPDTARAKVAAEIAKAWVFIATEKGREP